MAKTKVKNQKDSELRKLQTENLVLRDRISLKDESYFRQQMLSLMERQVIAQERQAEALKELAIPSDEEEEFEEEE